MKIKGIVQLKPNTVKPLHIIVPVYEDFTYFNWVHSPILRIMCEWVAFYAV